MERKRLEALFGSVWQAALDHAGLVSRRRAREIGAGEAASEAIEATIELLERLPMDQWPSRWNGLGKGSLRCPTLFIERLQHRLHDGMIAREDAVILWDAHESWRDSTTPIRNVTVGFLPKGAFQGLPRDHAERSSWVLWNRQWSHSHGLPLVSGSLENDGATPEGNVAQWIDRLGLEGAALESALKAIESRVIDFSRELVREYADQYYALRSEDDDDD